MRQGVGLQKGTFQFGSLLAIGGYGVRTGCVAGTVYGCQHSLLHWLSSQVPFGLKIYAAGHGNRQVFQKWLIVVSGLPWRGRELHATPGKPAEDPTRQLMFPMPEKTTCYIFLVQ